MAGVAKLYFPAVVNVTPYNKLNIGVPASGRRSGFFLPPTG